MPNTPTRKTHPELFKSLARVLGAMTAKKVFTRLPSNTYDYTGRIDSAFVWCESIDGQTFWSDIDARYSRLVKAYKSY